MGNIIIANMQATLTLDNHQFEEVAASSEARLEQLEERAKRLGAEGRSLIGADMADGGDQRRHQRQVERTQENREEVDLVGRTSAAAQTATTTEETGLRRRREAWQAYARTVEELYSRLGAAADVLASKQSRTAPELPEQAEAAVQAARSLQTQTQRAQEVAAPRVQRGGWTDGIPVQGAEPGRGTALSVLPPALSPAAPATLPPALPGTGITAEQAQLMVGVTDERRIQRLASTAARPAAPAKPPTPPAAPAPNLPTPEELRHMPLPDMFAAIARNREYYERLGMTEAKAYGPPPDVDPEAAVKAQEERKTAERLAQLAQGAPSRPSRQRIVNNTQVPAQAAQPTPPAQRGGFMQRLPFVGAFFGQRQAAPPAQPALPQPGFLQQRDDATLQARAEAEREPGESLVAAVQRLADEDEKAARAAARAAAAAASAGAPARGGRGRPTALSYERYMAQNTPLGGAVTGFAAQLSPQLAQLLPVVTSAGLAIAALGVALGQAAREALSADKQMFELTSTMRGSVEGFTGNTKFITEQTEAMRQLGFTNQETRQSFTEIVRWTQNTAEALNLQGLAADFARSRGLSLAQVTDLVTQTLQGSSGGWRQYGVMVGEAATRAETFRKVQQAVAGEAARFSETASGRTERLAAEWKDALEVAGQDLLPTVERLTQALIAFMPVVTGALQLTGSLFAGIVQFAGGAITQITNPYGELTDGAERAREAIQQLNEERARSGQGGLDFGEFGRDIAETVQFQQMGQGRQNTPEWQTTGRFQYRGEWYQDTAWSPEAGRRAEFEQAFFQDQAVSRFLFGEAALRGSPEYQRGYEAFTSREDIHGATERARALYGGTAATGAPVTPGTEAQGFFPNTAPEISSIKAIADEMSLTSQAVTGVQEAYKALSLFQVDENAVKANSERFAAAVRYLQELFVSIASSRADPEEYRIATIWLQSAQTVASVVTAGSQAFQAMFDTQAVMPTEQQQRAFQARIVQMMQFFKPVAEAMMPTGINVDNTSTEMAKLNALADTIQSMMGAAQTSANALQAVDDLRPPNPEQIRRFTAATKQTLDELGAALRELQEGGPEGMIGPRRPRSIVTESAIAEQASHIMQWAASTASVLSTIRSIRFPSAQDIHQFAERAQQLTQEFVRIAEEQERGPQEGGVMGALRRVIQSVLPDTETDPRLQRAGRYADNAQKLSSMAANVAQTFDAMRGLRLPSTSDIQAIARRSADLVNAMAAAVPQDTALGKPTDIADEAEWAEWGQKLVGLVGTTVGVYENMRRLRIPSQDQVADLAHRSVSLAQTVALAVPKGADGKPPDIEMEAEWAQFGSQLIGMVGAAANVYEGMRRLRIPSAEQQATISQRAVGMVTGLAAMVPKGPDGHPPDIQDEGEWAGFGSQLIGMVGAATNVYENMRRLRIPSQDQVAEVSRRAVSMVNTIAANVPKVGGIPPDLYDEAEWAQFGTSLIGMVSSATELFHNMRRLRIPDESTIREVVGQAAALPGMIAKYAPRNPDALMDAATWAQDAQQLVQLANSSAELLKGLRRFREPSRDDIDDFVGGFEYITGRLMSIGGRGRSDQMLANAEDWAAAIGPVVQVAQGTAELLQNLRRLRVPSEESVDEFVAMVDNITDKLMRITPGVSERMSMAAEDWALGVGPVVEVARSSAELLASLRTYRQPTIDHINDFLLSTEYVAEGFAQMSSRWSLDIAEHAGDIAEQQGKIFTTMQSAEGVFSGLHTLGKVPLVQIEGLFDNMDQAVGMFNSRAAAWNAEMDKSVLVVSGDIEAQMGAMSSGADFFLKLGKLKPDYSNAIRGFFSQLKLATQEFAKAVPDWKAQMNDDTKDVADAVTQQGNALSAALAPLLQIENATDIGPEQIKLAFMNARKALTYFSDLRNAPELQGDGAGGLLLFSSQIGEIFGAMQTTIDAVTALNEPSGELNTQMFGTIMNDFFLEAVPRYGQQWHITMGEMAADAAAFAQTTGAAIGSIPMHSLVGTTRSYSVAGTEGAGGVGGATAGGSLNTGPVYYNCVFLDGVQVGQDPNMDAFIARWTRTEDIRQGGVPVGAVAAGKR